MPVRAKICGVTTPADAAFAAEHGADAVGLNFYPKSPRYLPDEHVVFDIVSALPLFCTAIGVFVNPPLHDLEWVTHTFDVRAVQTYTERPLRWTWLHHARSIPAFRVKDRPDLAAIGRFVRESTVRPAAVLVDSFVAGEMGGTGHRAPWHLLEGFDPGVPLILAGGLTPDNVAEAIRQVRPWGVDVASGVESSPGRKDPHKVRDFLQAVRGAG